MRLALCAALLSTTCSSVGPSRPSEPAPTSGGLPNLTLNVDRLRTSALLRYEDFGPNACEVQEGCIGAAGRRRVLRFDVETPNLGEGDVYVGRPEAGDPRFEFSTCHGHRHFLGYAQYSLRVGETEVAHGHKQSFCLEDTQRLRADAARSGLYTCDGVQGIQAGWSDVYGRHLDCQFVDVTDVPPGRYTLRVDLNVNRGLVESSYDDNVGQVEIDIPAAEAPEGGPDPSAPTGILGPCPRAVTGVTRECGWTLQGTHQCNPGDRLNVGCNQGCSPPTGGCSGDPVLRVCAGDLPCSHFGALGYNDDACGIGNICANAQVTCPPEGRFTVLTGSFDGSPSTCNVAVTNR